MASKKEEKGTTDRPAEAGASSPEPTAQTARAAEKGAAQAGEISRRGGEQVRTFMNASTRAYRDITDFSRDDMDVLMQTGARIAKGFQDVGWEMMQLTQTSMRMGLQAANDMMTCRSVEDVIQVQRNFMKESVDTFLQESARLMEISSHLASDAVNPIAERFQSRTESGLHR